MSSEPIISLRHVSKVYAIFNKPQDRLKQMLARGRRKYYREFWALNDINLDIYRGETVGIIGRNGSGKSTLLQMICGVLTPTGGDLRVEGRVAALLELGAGFNPEFTGRENIFMFGALTGLSRSVVEKRFDAIAAFADIGEFIEQPVKTYSSGMYARLAFAAAINVDPQVLIIDEALSVGDEAFQRKCFSRIHSLKETGCTILFVSHSAGAVVELCDRAVLLDQGHRLFVGRPKTAIGLYQKLIYCSPEDRPAILETISQSAAETEIDMPPQHEPEISDGPMTPPVASVEGVERFDGGMRSESELSYAPNGATILDAHFENDQGERVNVLLQNRVYSYVYKVRFDKLAHRVLFAMMIKSKSGVELASTGSHPAQQGAEQVMDGSLMEVRFRFHNLLNPGTYFTNSGVTGFIDGEYLFLHRILDAVMFRVDQPANDRHHAGYVNLFPEPACHLLTLSGDKPAPTPS